MENVSLGTELFEVPVLVKERDKNGNETGQKKPEMHMFNRSQMMYYRSYADGQTLKTQIYFVNNPKGYTVECGYDELSQRLDRHVKVKRLLAGLTEDEIKELQEIAKGMIEKRAQK